MKIEVRDEVEIQRAHDMIVGILIGDAPNPIPGTQRDLCVACDVLCWILKHDHNQNFANNLTALERELMKLGYGVTEV